MSIFYQKSGSKSPLVPNLKQFYKKIEIFLYIC